MRLETERLILREWKRTDIGDLVEGLNNPRVSTWLAFVPHPYTRDDAGSWIRRCVGNARKGKERLSYEFAIELKSEGKVIGGVSLDRISKVHGTAGGGIWLNEKFQGRGYGTKAFGERIRFAFEDPGLRRLENGFLKENPSSLRVQARFGYRIEGVKREAYRCLADGKLKHECITGLLRDEWVGGK
jgi:ribosomal-protein-alanine N-acetyltransferase